jgi:membrane-associated phospholipid phosphatase
MRDAYCASILAFVTICLYYAAHEWKGINCISQHPGIVEDLTYLKPKRSHSIPDGVEHIMFVVLVLLCMKYKRNRFYTIPYYIIGSYLGNGVQGLIKKSMCSPRPYAGLYLNDPNTFMSTPSGHTFYATFGTLYVSYYLWLVCKDSHVVTMMWMLMSIFPFGVGVSRVIDNHHFPVDILYGGILAFWVCGLVCRMHYLSIKKNKCE